MGAKAFGEPLKNYVVIQQNQIKPYDKQVRAEWALRESGKLDKIASPKQKFWIN